MLKHFKDRPNTLLLSLIGVWTLLNVAAAVAGDLSGAEAYLWYAARELEWGYIDLSPLAVFFAWLGVNFAGGCAFGVRLFFVLLQGAALYVFYRVASRSTPTTQGIWLYFTIAFSVPLLQIYGLFASTEIIFLFATTITFWSFDGYLRNDGWGRQGLLGLGFAMLVAASPAGIFVVLAILIANPRVLVSWRFYAAGVVAGVLLTPIVWWQVENGWPAVVNFMPITSLGGVGAVGRGLLTMFTWFNPFLLVPFLVLITRRGRVEPIERTVRVLFWLFLAVIFLAAVRGADLGVWITPVVLSVLYVLMSAATTRQGLRRYLLVFCSCTGVAFVLLRAMIIIEPQTASVLELDDNSIVARAAADTLRARGVETLVLQDDAHNASIMSLYTSMPTSTVGSIYGQASVYDTRANEQRFTGHCVAVEISSHARLSTTSDSLALLYTRVELGAPERTAYLAIVPDYHSLRDVRIEIETLPGKVLTASRIALLLKITNPYPYDIEIGQANGTVLNIYLRQLPLGKYTRVGVPFKSQTLFAHSTISIASTITIPTVQTAAYSLGLVLERYPLAVSYNSSISSLHIVNPKSRI